MSEVVYDVIFKDTILINLFNFYLILHYFVTKS